MGTIELWISVNNSTVVEVRTELINYIFYNQWINNGNQKPVKPDELKGPYAILLPLLKKKNSN